jgi:hypothetical protein
MHVSVSMLWYELHDSPQLDWSVQPSNVMYGIWHERNGNDDKQAPK